MPNFTSNTYTLKREILNFTNKISRKLSKLDRKFPVDMTYGMLASGSCLLTDIVGSDIQMENQRMLSLKKTGAPV